MTLDAKELDAYIEQLLGALNNSGLRPEPQIVIAMAVLAFDMAREYHMPMSMLLEVLKAYGMTIDTDPHAATPYLVADGKSDEDLPTNIVLPPNTQTH